MTKKEKGKKAGSGLDMKAVAVIAILGLLIIVSAFQAVELSSLKEKIGTEFDQLGTLSAAGNTAPSSATDLKKNLAELPQMVGGC